MNRKINNNCTDTDTEKKVPKLRMFVLNISQLVADPYQFYMMDPDPKCPFDGPGSEVLFF